METSFGPFALLSSFGIVQAIFWAIVLLSLKRGNVVANRILALLLLLFSIGIASTILYETKYILSYPHFAEIATPILFVYPPLFFLYVKRLTSESLNLKISLFHFIPFLICTAYVFPFYINGAEYKTHYLLSTFNNPSQEYLVISNLFIVQELIYIVLTLKLVARHVQKIKDTYSAIEKINLAWIRNLIIALILVWVLYVFVEIVESPIQSNLIVAVSITIFIYVMGFMGLRQPAVFLEGDHTDAKKKYQKSGLTPDKAEKYLKKLLDFMETEKPYIDQNLTLHQLAKKLSISTHHLSQLLNEKLNQAFFDFVNSYRVDEAKKELADPDKDHFTILAIAYNAGFNSKSSFNAAFKKHTSMTPSQFKKAMP
ncbi:helix-turn-helix domain-containing protein [candidate division KSB1 bacterium]|nr:helix-turn-helix domain-containing protein [candidate division KSB1 bacterium]